MRIVRHAAVAVLASLALVTGASAQPAVRAGQADMLQSGACPSGQLNCAGVCKDPSVDSTNCGRCGAVCAPGSVCSGGQCGVTCGAGLTNCSGRCTYVQFDPHNCGGCGAGCGLPSASTTACVQGSCAVVTCNSGFGNCDGMAANGCEDNLSSDARNCGGCGIACAAANATSSCASGSCTFSCNSGFANCNGVTLDGCEANLASDPRNCGACGHGCLLGCVNGACRI